MLQASCNATPYTPRSRANGERGPHLYHSALGRDAVGDLVGSFAGNVTIWVKWAPNLASFAAAFCSLRTRARQCGRVLVLKRTIKILGRPRPRRNLPALYNLILLITTTLLIIFLYNSYLFYYDYYIEFYI